MVWFTTRKRIKNTFNPEHDSWNRFIDEIGKPKQLFSLHHALNKSYWKNILSLFIFAFLTLNNAFFHIPSIEIEEAYNLESIFEVSGPCSVHQNVARVLYLNIFFKQKVVKIIKTGKYFSKLATSQKMFIIRMIWNLIFNSIDFITDLWTAKNSNDTCFMAMAGLQFRASYNRAGEKEPFDVSNVKVKSFCHVLWGEK